MKLKHLRFAGLLFGALFLCPAHAQTPSGSVSRSTWVNTTLGQCFPTNNQGLITASVLRNCMTTLADSVLFSQSALSDLPTGPSTMPSGFTYPSPFVSGTFTVNGSSSGAAAIVAQAAAGSPTLTLPTGSGTFAVSASSPLSLNTTTGALTCATCQTTPITGSSPINVTGGVVSLQGASGTVAQGSAGTGSAFTATPTLGVAGSTLGTVTFANLTSGGITLAPPTGALGSVTLTLPDTTTTLAGLGVAQTFSAAQTFSSGVTLSGLSSGTCSAGIVLNSGNQIVTGACPGAASSIMVGGTTVTSGTSPFLLYNNGGTLGNESIGTALSAIGSNISAPGGRLTLASHTPVMSTTQSAKTTIFYDSYRSGTVPYFNGTADLLDTITSNEMSLVLESSGTGVENANGVFDIWWWHNSGSPVVCVATNGAGGGWASDTGGSNTARGTGYSKLDNSTRAYITNGSALAHCYNATTDYGSIAANQATYLGTVMTDASTAGSVSFTLGGSGAGGVAGYIGVWNYYNRVLAATIVTDSGSSYSYGSATVRAADASNSNRVTLVQGVAEDMISAKYASAITPSASANGAIGICLNSTSAFSGLPSVNGGSSQYLSAPGTYDSPPVLGQNYFQACENAPAGVSATFNTSISGGAIHQGLSVIWRY